MVALNFLNLSQRPDTNGAVNEVKASIPVNRFRAEHIAFVRTMECELILHLNNGSWRPISGGTPVTVKPATAEGGNLMDQIPYTTFEDNLPMGYEQDNSLLNVHHTIVCTKKRLEEVEEDAYEEVDCNSTSHRYALSYARIPTKWLNKTTDAGGAVKPQPMLVNLLSKASSSGSIYGWTDCTLSECLLKGFSSKVGYTDKEEDEETGEVDYVMKYTRISPDSGLWSIPDFESVCKSSQFPCFFAYEKFDNSDKGKHCKHLVEACDDPEECDAMSDAVCDVFSD